MFENNKHTDIIVRAHTFRLEPDAAQFGLMNRISGIVRSFRNRLLETVNNLEKYPGLSLLTAQCAAMKKDQALGHLKLAPSQSLQCAAIELDRSFQNFFAACKKKRAGKTGRPRFHRRGRDESFRYPQGGFASEKGAGFRIDQENNLVYLPKIGWVKYRNSRDISVYKSWSGGRPKAAVVKKKGDKWFITIFTEYQGKRPERTQDVTAPLGIDRGVLRSFQTSSGEWFNFPSKLENISAWIKRLQRRRARKCKKFSRSWRDIGRKIRNLHIRAGNIKRDFLHKLTTGLSQARDLIAVERLEIADMTKSAKGTLENPGRSVKQKAGLNREILARNWGGFVQLLKYKLEEAGKWLIEVDPRHTSQTCAKCGFVSKDNRRSQSLFVCGACGHADNADRNAALNILARGIEAFLEIIGRLDKASCVGNIVADAKRTSGEGFERPVMTPAGVS